MSLHEWFEKGLTPEQYMETLDKHKDAFHHIYEHFNISNDEDFFTDLKDKKLRAVILAEPWCGHCMLNIPILLHLAKKADMPVKFLLRDENLELMDQYLTNGKSRTIPIMIFINEDGEEVAKWGPIASTTKQFVDRHRIDLPEKDAKDYEDKFKAFIEVIAKEFQENGSIWDGVYTSIKNTLTKI